MLVSDRRQLYDSIVSIKVTSLQLLLQNQTAANLMRTQSSIPGICSWDNHEYGYLETALNYDTVD